MNSFGRIFRLSIYGESHGECIGIILDGVPPGIEIRVEDFKNDLNRRKPGALGTTTRIESDIPNIISGVHNNFSTGSPINIQFSNENIRSEDYKNFENLPRPGHADFTKFVKYKGFSDNRGGGHSSGRLTLGLVAAGVIAKKIIKEFEIEAKLIEAGGNKDIQLAIELAIESGNSIGGIVECVAKNIQVGLGEPFFDSLESYISHLAFSIPAIKGIEFGNGFESASLTGKENNDEIIDKFGRTKSNNAGGINGGITNGNDIIFRLAVKPTSSISQIQKTFNLKTGEVSELRIVGRHDACIALRVPVIAEAITAIALADFYLLNK